MGDALHSPLPFLNYDLSGPIHLYRLRYRSASILSINDLLEWYIFADRIFFITHGAGRRRFVSIEIFGNGCACEEIYTLH